MSNRKLGSISIPRDLRFAFGYVESKPMPKTKSQPTGNRLWDSQPTTRQRLFDETRARLESDLERARQAGDWGKVNRLAALLCKLTMRQ